MLCSTTNLHLLVYNVIQFILQLKQLQYSAQRLQFPVKINLINWSIKKANKLNVYVDYI